MNNENTIAPINEDLDVAIYEVEEIKEKIYTIRGKQVMLDSDVANLYHYKTKDINLTFDTYNLSFYTIKVHKKI